MAVAQQPESCLRQLGRESQSPNELDWLEFGRAQTIRQGRLNAEKANAIGSCAKEDRRCAEGEMGEGEGGEEDSSIFIGRILDGKPRAKVLDGF